MKFNSLTVKQNMENEEENKNILTTFKFSIFFKKKSLN